MANLPPLGLKAGLALLPVLALGAWCGSAHASPNLVQNGNFDQTLISGSYQFGSAYPSQQVTDWTTGGYNFVFQPGTADTSGATGQYGVLQLWGPNDGSSNGLPASSPAGGNFIAADGDFNVAPISQTLTGLTPGQTIAVSFYWAGAQQHGFTGPTTEQWQVSLGSETQSTPVVDNVNHGFTGWMQQTFDFTATGSSEVLSFLAVGTPVGLPPFSLLDGVTATATAVPEPAAATILAVGVAGLFGFARLRRRASGRRMIAAAE